jgi:hypothetical protein
VKDRPRRLIGKIAVVTGASKGIGARPPPVVNYSGSREGADKVVADIVAPCASIPRSACRAPRGSVS